MAFTELQIKQIEAESEKFMKVRRPPKEIRSQVDLKVEIEKQNVFIYEVRPYWKDNSVITKRPLAKTTYVKKTNIWEVFWMRQDLKWHTYEPCPTINNAAAFFNLVNEDELGCFFG